MFYIPNDLYQDFSNEEAVHITLEKYYGSDVLTDPDREMKCRGELSDLGEDKILEKLPIILRNY